MGRNDRAGDQPSSLSSLSALRHGVCSTPKSQTVWLDAHPPAGVEHLDYVLRRKLRYNPTSRARSTTSSRGSTYYYTDSNTYCFTTTPQAAATLPTVAAIPEPATWARCCSRKLHRPRLRWLSQRKERADGAFRLIIFSHSTFGEALQLFGTTVSKPKPLTVGWTARREKRPR